MTVGVRYLSLLVGWITLFAVPMFAGDFWDTHYHVYQSITSLAVIGLARKLFPKSWWADDLAVVAMLQIVHAIADYASPGNPELYDTIQAGLNGLEFTLLIIGGIWEAAYGRGAADSHSPAGRDSRSRIERSGHA